MISFFLESISTKRKTETHRKIVYSLLPSISLAEIVPEAEARLEIRLRVARQEVGGHRHVGLREGLLDGVDLAVCSLPTSFPFTLWDANCKCF